MTSLAKGAHPHKWIADFLWLTLTGESVSQTSIQPGFLSFNRHFMTDSTKVPLKLKPNLKCTEPSGSDLILAITQMKFLKKMTGLSTHFLCIVLSSIFHFILRRLSRLMAKVRRGSAAEMEKRVLVEDLCAVILASDLQTGHIIQPLITSLRDWIPLKDPSKSQLKIVHTTADYMTRGSCMKEHLCLWAHHWLLRLWGDGYNDMTNLIEEKLQLVSSLTGLIFMPGAEDRLRIWRGTDPRRMNPRKPTCDDLLSLLSGGSGSQAQEFRDGLQSLANTSLIPLIPRPSPGVEACRSSSTPMLDESFNGVISKAIRSEVRLLAQTVDRARGILIRAEVEAIIRQILPMPGLNNNARPITTGDERASSTKMFTRSFIQLWIKNYRPRITRGKLMGPPKVLRKIEICVLRSKTHPRTIAPALQ